MEEQPEPRSESADLCPCCGRACGGVKVRHVTGCVFLLCAVEWNKYRIAGCPACVRRALKRHLRRNLLTANLLWPFLVLPSVLAAKRGLDEPGPSPEWQKLVDAVDRLKAGIARNAEGAADELPPLPVAPETRHSGGEPFRPSRGPFGKKCFIGLLLWMLLVLPAGSFLYALASYELPWAAVGLLALFVLAALNGGGISVIARSCRCRSPIGLRIAALALGAWSVYLSWVGWVWILNEFWSLGLIFDPLRLSRVMRFVAEDGFRAMGDRVVSAWEWYLFWAAEAGVLILTPAAMVWNTLKSAPVCHCGRPFVRFFSLRQLNLPPDLKAFRKQLESGEFGVLTELPLRTGNPFLETEILHCEACNDDYLPVVRIVTETLDPRGEIVRNSAPCAAPVFCGAAAVTRLAERRAAPDVTRS